MIGILLVIASALGILLWYLNERSNGYFRKLNVPYIPAPLLGGQLKDMILQRKSLMDVVMDIYNDPKTKREPVVGIRFLHIHGLVIRDRELIKRILVKDFQAFQDRRTSSDVHSDPLGGNNLFLLKNPLWRTVRSKITPVFTGNKIRQLFHLVNQVGEDLNAYLEKTIPESTVLDVKSIAALYTTDVIATCAYGVQANSLKDPNSSFRAHGKKVFDFNVWRAIEFALVFVWPEVVPYLKIKTFTNEATEFLTETLVDVMNQREKNKIQRNDLIDLLLTLRKKNATSEEEKKTLFDDEVLVSQAAVFFTAGFETTSSAMGFTLYELAKQKTLQKRLRKEILEFLRDNKTNITYESVQKLPYLEMCCQETFRMYPPLAYLDRECTPEAIGQDSYSLEPVSTFRIPRGFPVFIPVYAIHRDERYFPEPLKYNPERFSDENKHSIPAYAFAPFGQGPRDCIGKRFGIMQVKLGLIHFLRSHIVEVAPETQQEIKMHRMAFILTPKDGIVLRIRRATQEDDDEL